MLAAARETLACLEVAVALGDIPTIDANARAALDHIIGTLVRILRPPPVTRRLG
jgi:hypothetical protein